MDLQARIDLLTEKMTEAQASMGAIIAQAGDEGREDLTQDETTKLGDIQANFDLWKTQRERLEKTAEATAEMNAPMARLTVDDDQADDGEDDDQPAPRAAKARAHRAPITGNQPIAGMRGPSMARSPQAMQRDGQRGFVSFGEYAQACYLHATDNRQDPRLQFMANQSSLTGGDGGHLVPPDFRDEIMRRVLAEDNLLSRTDLQRSARGEVTYPRDHSTPWGTSGVRAYWGRQGASLTESDATFEPINVKASKLHAYVLVTEEIFEDAPALDGYLRSKMPEAVNWMVADAIVNGDGVGKPLGFASGGGLVTVAKETSQTADTIVAGNVRKMFARMPNASRSSAVWLIHPSAEEQLSGMTIGDMPVYLPPGGLRDAPYGSLMGRPVIPHQACQVVGDLGDIYFFDPRQYLSVLKTGSGRSADGMKFDVSMHFKFDTDELAYRLTMRVGGAPWWDQAISSNNGSFDMSPYVTLAART